ncbi:pilus assembly protein PilM [Christensenellaceae bacterium 44-20]
MAKLNAVLEIGTSKIVCLIERPGGEALTSVPGACLVRYDGIKNGKWSGYSAFAEDLMTAISGAESQVGKTIKSCAVGVPGCFCKIVFREGKKKIKGLVKEEDIDWLVNRLKPKEVGGADLIDVRPAYFMDDRDNVYLNEPINLKTATLRCGMTYFYGHKPFLDSVERALLSRKISVDKFICEPLAQALHYIPQQERDATSAIIDIGYYSTGVTVAYGDTILAHSTIDLGGSTVTNRLVSRLDIRENLAESLKRRHIFGIDLQPGEKVYAKDEAGRMVQFDAASIKNSIDEIADIVCTEVRRELYRYRNYLRKDAKIYLIGAGISMQGFDAYLKRQIHANLTLPPRNKYRGLPAIYNSGVALLDNNSATVYHLRGNEIGSKIRDKVNRFLNMK